ncbi:MAG: hypothetical protein LBC37_06785 [Zoogloeaceae bacterium]|nr:hypothetical protein [Zoogloeaceae bacterium]
MSSSVPNTGVDGQTRAGKPIDDDESGNKVLPSTPADTRTAGKTKNNERTTDRKNARVF